MHFNSSFCSPVDVPNGDALTKLVESLMTLNVDRTGLNQLDAKEFR